MFECSFDANPVMYDGIRWVKQTKESEKEESFSRGSSRVSINWDNVGGHRVTSRLIIRNVTVQDAGKIFCVVSNGYGEEAREETYLLVKRKNLKVYITQTIENNKVVSTITAALFLYTNYQIRPAAEPLSSLRISR